jgi:hypothetical protein
MIGAEWNAVRAARIPAAALAALAALRHRTDFHVHPDGEAFWVRWEDANPNVVEALFPVAGATFFIPQNGAWRRVNHRLPTAEAPPSGEGRTLDSLLLPATFHALPAPSHSTSPSALREPIAIRIVAGGLPQAATALACRLADLAAWVESATTHELQSVRAARSGDRVILLGRTLPIVPGSARYWGESLLTPLGFRAEPDLPTSVIREAVGAAADELALLNADGASCIPKAAFEPLSRASLRLAIRRGAAP